MIKRCLLTALLVLSLFSIASAGPLYPVVTCAVTPTQLWIGDGTKLNVLFQNHDVSQTVYIDQSATLTAADNGAAIMIPAMGLMPFGGARSSWWCIGNNVKVGVTPY